MSPPKKDPIPPKKRRPSFHSFFLTELKERKIIQTLAAFIGGGWLIMEFVHWVLIDHYHLPEQSLDITIVTLLCIMVCTLTLTWRWLGTIEKPRKIKFEFIVIPLVILIAAYLDIRFMLHIVKPELELASIEIVSEGTMAFDLPEGPSVAVLPFTNLSGDPTQEYFSDGLSENIITGLSGCPKLFVIARNSTFAYKGKPVNLQQIARELGVQYIVEGSIQRYGNLVRITAQLIDATTGYHLWAEKYDRDLKDIFALQDEITLKVMNALQVKLTDGEQARLLNRGSGNIEAYMKGLKAIEYVRRGNKEDNALARQEIEGAIALEQDNSLWHALLAETHIMDLWYGSKYPLISLTQASKSVKKAIALDDTNFVAYLALSNLYLMRGQHEKAIAAAERAVVLNPNGAEAYAFLGYTLAVSGRAEEGIEFCKKAILLSPIPPSTYLHQLGIAYRIAGRYDEAISVYRQAINRYPSNLFAHLGLAAIYSLLGREEEARAEAAEVLKINPKFSLEDWEKRCAAIGLADKGPLIDALRKTGLPE
jgi:adenylate cyclase